jgi:hypothetical protein
MLDPTPYKDTRSDRIFCGAFLLLVLKGPLAVYLIAHFVFGVN